MANSKEAPTDTVFNIETILDIRDIEEVVSNECKFCKKSYKTKSNLDKHLINKHPNLTEAKGPTDNNKKE